MKKGSIFGIMVIAIGIAVIISTYSSTSTYGTFTDASQNNAQLHIVGHLDKTKRLVYDAAKDANYFAFYMQDKNGRECKVTYTGTEPQDFEKSEQIVVTGQMEGSDFHAATILMKCPSKYVQDKIKP